MLLELFFLVMPFAGQSIKALWGLLPLGHNNYHSLSASAIFPTLLPEPWAFLLEA